MQLLTLQITYSLFTHGIKRRTARSVDTRLIQAISRKNFKIEVRGRKPVSARGVLVRLTTKTDVEILEQVIKENEALKETVQVTVPKLRNPLVIAYDATYQTTS